MKDVDRRSVILGGIAAALVPCNAEAAMACGPVMGGVQVCQAGLPGFLITAQNASTIQEKQNWCWAACISGIFSWHGKPVSQHRIVEKLFGSDIDQPASGEEIYNAVNGYWEDDSGNTFSASANPLIDSNYSFTNPLAAQLMSLDLSNNFPLIVGTRGHATIVTAMSWATNTWGQQQITDVTVRDPWPDNPRKRSLSAEEFSNIFLIMQVRVN